MATVNDLARDYVKRLAHAKSNVMAKSTSAGVKIAEARRELREELLQVFRAIDGLTYSATGSPLSTDDREALLQAMDDLCGLETGSFAMMKKGSIADAIRFEQYVSFLADNVDFE